MEGEHLCGAWHRSASPLQGNANPELVAGGRGGVLVTCSGDLGLIRFLFGTAPWLPADPQHKILCLGQSGYSPVRAPAGSQPASPVSSGTPCPVCASNVNSPHLRPQNLSVDETPSQEDLRKVLRGRLPFPHQGCTRPQKYAHDHYRGDQDHETHSETDLGCPREVAAGSVPRHLAKFVVGHGAPVELRLG